MSPFLVALLLAPVTLAQRTTFSLEPTSTPTPIPFPDPYFDNNEGQRRLLIGSTIAVLACAAFYFLFSIYQFIAGILVIARNKPAPLPQEHKRSFQYVCAALGLKIAFAIIGLFVGMYRQPGRTSIAAEMVSTLFNGITSILLLAVLFRILSTYRKQFEQAHGWEAPSKFMQLLGTILMILILVLTLAGVGVLGAAGSRVIRGDNISGMAMGHLVVMFMRMAVLVIAAGCLFWLALSMKRKLAEAGEVNSNINLLTHFITPLMVFSTVFDLVLSGLSFSPANFIIIALLSAIVTGLCQLIVYQLVLVLGWRLKAAAAASQPPQADQAAQPQPQVQAVPQPVQDGQQQPQMTQVVAPAAQA